ncbi:MAG: hypothetical protein HY736_20570 [Verrucomicrobia bacterium]|nr:hypothetical protein [Verrucomicrobiota bacterium]
MTAAEIRQFVDASPFVAFRLHLADGRKLDVPHPDFIHVFKTDPRAIVESERGGWQFVNLPLILTIELVNHGKRRARR